MKVLVAGPTGGTGREVVKQLVAENAIVTAFARDPVKAETLLPPEANVVRGDVLDAVAVSEAMTGMDAVICALGPKNFLDPFEPYNVDFKGSGNLVSAAEKAEVRKFVLVSTIGTDMDNLLLRLAFWGVLYFKKQGELRLQNSTLDYTIVRPAGLRDEPKEGMETANVNIYRAGERGWSGSILRSDVARCCIEALVQPAASNKVVEILAENDATKRDWPTLFKSVS